MAETTKIEWADSTLNIWEGCQKTGSPACEGCYAEARNLRYAPKGSTSAPNWGPHAPRREVKSWRATLRKISRLALAAFAAGRTEPWFVFVNSLSDFWDNQADKALRAEALREFAKHPHLTFLLLTKRPQNIVKMVKTMVEADQGPYSDERGVIGWWPRNVAIGCTVVTQYEADRDVPYLLVAKAALRPAFAFLSIEPMIEPVDLTMVRWTFWSSTQHMNVLTGKGNPSLGSDAPIGQVIDWVIAGGESSQGKHQARPCNPDAFIDLQIQCEDTETPFMFKQWGDWIPSTPKSISDTNDPRWRRVGVHWMNRVGTRGAGRTLLGKTYDARPEVRP